MARKPRQKISYVLPLADSAGGHRLGVNGLAVDEDSSILYSGGRDGVICAWDLNLDLRQTSRQVSSPTSKPPPPPVTTWRRQVQAHTHWVNDIALAQNKQALVSASSDITVKIWRPAAEDVIPPQTIGLHNDYVKVLAVPDQQSQWVASGSLDRKIQLWDLNGGGGTLTIDVGQDEGASGLGRDKGSVYALAATPSVLASGGPESTVRLWDPRSGKRITRLVGHTDIIRDILISEDGGTILTASGDQTVKVWSVAAGRCTNTLTMHDASVWSLWSTHPQLSVFYSSDRSGLVAKTDTRGCSELEEGLSVAVCQEHESVHKVINAGDYIWTATHRPSINRWRDVDTEGAEVEMPENYKSHRMSMQTIRSRLQNQSPQVPQSPPMTPTSPPPNAENKIALKHVLRLSNTTFLPKPHSTGGTGADINGDGLEIMEPLRQAPDSHVEGQNGLIKHVMLNDRKRVLTMDTAGEVMMWDLLKCVPIKSFGKRHLEDVQPEVTTFESVPNWCSVDTRTGSLAVTLEENNAFDAEMYADDLDLEEAVEFKDDQRINYGKWVLRYLFANLISEEVRRDQQYRRHLLHTAKNQKLERENAPSSIQLPSRDTNGWHDIGGPATSSTVVKAPSNGLMTSSSALGIGSATPAAFGSPVRARTSETSNGIPALSDDGAPLEKRVSASSAQGRKGSDKGADYFGAETTGTAGLTSPTDTVKMPMTPGAEEADESKDTPSKFGKKFRMNMSFGMKKLTKTTTAEAGSGAPAGTANKVEDKDGKEDEKESDSRSSKTSNSRVVDDNFMGCVQRIRYAYEDDIHAQVQRRTAVDSAGGALGQSKELELTSLVQPSTANETPVLKPPPNTTILIQEDRPEAGGVADLFEGKVGTTGELTDVIEKVAPMWLADVLLRNTIPVKDVVKISFVLEPWKNAQGLAELPVIGDNSDGNSRLNANRMLRARKILAYVAERIEPGAAATPDEPHYENPFKDPDQLRPEEYLELYCNGQMIHPKMTLATIRANVWKSGGDILLFYRANGRKEIAHTPKAGTLSGNGLSVATSGPATGY